MIVRGVAACIHATAGCVAINMDYYVLHGRGHHGYVVSSFFFCKKIFETSAAAVSTLWRYGELNERVLACFGNHFAVDIP